MVFVVSDFISAPDWSDAMARLSLRHEVLAVRLYDASEMNLPDLGMVTIEDAETGEHLAVDTHEAAFRERFAQLAEKREAAMRDALARSGVDTLEVATEDDLVDAVLRFSEMRLERSRLSSGGGLPAHLRSPDPTASRQGAEGARGGLT
jgi:uncharacterized protein (DUF58 family)